MTIKMKALRSFGTKKANEGHLRRGQEFDVLDDARAKDLESRGHAHRVEVRAESAPLNKMEPPPQNKAAQYGPLLSVGGETGEESAPSSSDQVRQPRARVSRKPKDGFDL